MVGYAGIPLTLNADAHYSADKVSIRRGRLKLHTLELVTAGDVQFGDVTVLNLSVDSQPATLDGWDKIIPAIASYQLAGTMDVKATVRGKVGKGAAPQIQGTLNLKKASAKPPEFPKPIENLDTKINFTGQRAAGSGAVGWPPHRSAGVSARAVVGSELAVNPAICSSRRMASGAPR